MTEEGSAEDQTFCSSPGLGRVCAILSFNFFIIKCLAFQEFWPSLFSVGGQFIKTAFASWGDLLGTKLHFVTSIRMGCTSFYISLIVKAVQFSERARLHQL